MRKVALIMAGGRGERFWPRSRKDLPKQFLDLTGEGKTMIQMTVERISSVVECQDIYIATNGEYKKYILQQLPQIPKDNILCEPIGRNTAPCIGMGAICIRERYKDAVMMVLPSDHLIKYPDIFVNSLQEACEVAESGANIVTIGITPEYPETGYGYIKFDAKRKIRNAFAVEKFVEKPDLSTAEMYIDSKQYLWNSGMFVWKISTILSNIKSYLPDMMQKLEILAENYRTINFEEKLREIYPKLESISIDYGVMEKAEQLYTIPGAFGWDDVGSWLAVGRLKENDEKGNVISGNVLAVNCKECILEGTDKLIAVVGTQNLIVVDTEDATLVCDKEHTMDIRIVLEQLKTRKKHKYI